MYDVNRAGDTLQPKDEIVDVIIGFGRWQLFATLLLSTAMFLHLLNTGTEAVMRPDGWWCKKPDALKNWTNIEWIMYSHSSESCVGICHRKTWDQKLVADGYFRGCQIYKYDYKSLSNVKYSNRPQIISTDIIPCPYGMEYSHNAGQNLAEKYGMGCDNGTITSTLWQSASTFGKIVGYVAMGALSDRFGRKLIFFIACGVTPAGAIVVVLSHTWIFNVVASSIYGFFDGGFGICLILILEVSTNKTRSQLLAFGCCTFAMGIGLTVTVNYLFRSHDVMLVTTNCLFLLMFMFTSLIPESPPWLFCSRKIKKLEKCVKNGAKMNKMSIPDNFQLIYVETGDDRYKLPKRRPGLWDIISEPEVAYEIIGITYLMMLYGIVFGSSTYEILATATKSHLANSLLAMAVVIGVLCGQTCSLLMGHRKILQISILFVLISSIMLTVNLHELKPTSTGPTITFLLFNIGIVSLSYSVLLNYNTRTVPTQLRGTLFGFWKAVWMLFVWIGNHDFATFTKSPFSVLITCIIAAFFSLNLKDVNNRELPDTIFDSFCFEWKTKQKRWALGDKSTLLPSVKKSSWNFMKIFRKKKNSVEPTTANESVIQ